MNTLEFSKQADEYADIECSSDGDLIWCRTRDKKFAELVAAHEREECAKVCDHFQARDVGMQPAECAGAIRARSKE